MFSFKFTVILVKVCSRVSHSPRLPCVGWLEPWRRDLFETRQKVLWVLYKQNPRQEYTTAQSYLWQHWVTSCVEVLPCVGKSGVWDSPRPSNWPLVENQMIASWDKWPFLYVRCKWCICDKLVWWHVRPWLPWQTCDFWKKEEESSL